MALHIGIGNFSGAIASNIYRTRDAPRYVVGREYAKLFTTFIQLIILFHLIKMG